MPGGGGAIKILPVEIASGQFRAGQPDVFLQSAATSNLYPRFSQDGRWLAYNDAESGTFEVHVRAFPSREAKWQISNSGGSFPVWSSNGHELFYRSLDDRIMVVNYSIRGNDLSADKPRLWSGRRLFNLGIAPTFDLAPDGQLFAALMRPGGDQPRLTQDHVTLMLNFSTKCAGACRRRNDVLARLGVRRRLPIELPATGSSCAMSLKGDSMAFRRRDRGRADGVKQ